MCTYNPQAHDSAFRPNRLVWRRTPKAAPSSPARSVGERKAQKEFKDIDQHYRDFAKAKEKRAGIGNKLYKKLIAKPCFVSPELITTMYKNPKYRQDVNIRVGIYLSVNTPNTIRRALEKDSKGDLRLQALLMDYPAK